mmetsp:Transcript_6611/g.10736  ORF Transcript_6611/g.10736 Transcript_6611/m.10736 type:complete len:95 (-) Transcript_6611:281-565(-)
MVVVVLITRVLVMAVRCGAVQSSPDDFSGNSPPLNKYIATHHGRGNNIPPIPIRESESITKKRREEVCNTSDDSTGLLSPYSSLHERGKCRSKP